MPQQKSDGQQLFISRQMPSNVTARDVKSREFFFSIREIFSRDSTRILDHVMMSHPWPGITDEA